MTMPPSSPSADEGIRLLQQGDARGAADILLQVTREDTTNARAFQFLGIARSQSGDLNGGIEALREASRLDPANTGILFNLGIAFSQANQPAAARNVLERVLTLDPSYAKARAALERMPVTATTEGVPPALTPASLPGTPVATAAPGLAPVGGGGSGGMATLGAVGGGGGGTTAEGTLASPPPPAAATPTLPPQAPSLYSTNAPVPELRGNGSGAYVPPATASAQSFSREPTAGERIGRGLKWGAIYGQWWTLWMVVWELLVGGVFKGTMSMGAAAFGTVVFAIVFGFIGAIVGLIIAAVNAETGTGAGIGIGTGMLLLGCEFLISHSGSVLINIFFWFFTGRFVGANIAGKVQQLVEP